MWFPDCSPMYVELAQMVQMVLHWVDSWPTRWTRLVFFRSNREKPEGSESDQLHRDPERFVVERYRLANTAADSNQMELPDYLVVFSDTARSVQTLLADADYVKVLHCCPLLSPTSCFVRRES